MPTTDEQTFLTVLELAAYLKISRRKAYELIDRGEVPWLKVGAMYRIPKDELDRQLADAVTGCASGGGLP
jgi:excisionase family DNA binding protein